MTSPLDFALLFDEFKAPSWSRWRSILGDLGPEVRELYVCAGRGSGKSRTVALLACAMATRRYRLAAGERVFASVIAPDRRQAALTHDYARGLIASRPELEALIVSERNESVTLANGVTLEVVTASTAAPRGRSYCFVGLEEAAYFPTGDSAHPDREILRAVRPGLARVPGSLLAVVSSPWARRGILWEASRRHEESPSPRLIYVNARTLDLNPSFDAQAIEAARAEDPIGAATEYDAAFRSDVESYVSRDVVEDNVERGRHELPPVNLHRTEYRAFLDLAGGSGTDSATLAVAHVEEVENGLVSVVLDCLRERRPPFSPEAVCAEFAETLKSYRISRATADRYAADFATEAMARNGVTLDRSEKPKSDLYRELLPILNSGHVDLLDHPRLVEQLVGLERRTARGGRDSIDHAPRGHDDLANVVAGVVVEAFGEAARPAGAEAVLWGRTLERVRAATSVQSGFQPEQRRDLLKRRALFGRVAAAAAGRTAADFVDELKSRYGIT